MAVYRFRVAFEEYEDTYRDIDILANQTFRDFHSAIQQAIGFDGSKPASFFMSNDNWKKGQEITLDKSSGKAGPGAVLMSDSVMNEFIADPHQKIYYVFDPPSQWTFFIELTRIMANDPSKSYPCVTRIMGEAPKQYLVVEPPKGTADLEFGEEELLLDGEEDGEETDIIASDEEEGTEGGDEFGDGVDEEEYDNIEERSEEGQEREDY